jgi:hypothetical protein
LKTQNPRRQSRSRDNHRASSAEKQQGMPDILAKVIQKPGRPSLLKSRSQEDDAAKGDESNAQLREQEAEGNVRKTPRPIVRRP